MENAMRIETERLLITEFCEDMAEAVHRNSLDEDTRRFVPDEVFETVEDARETVEFLISRYGEEDGPFVYPVLLKTGENIGYVQLVKADGGWELVYRAGLRHGGREGLPAGHRGEKGAAGDPRDLPRGERRRCPLVLYSHRKGIPTESVIGS